MGTSATADSGQQRDDKDAVRHLEQQVRGGEHAETAVRDPDLLDDRDTDLADDDVPEHPPGQGADLAHAADLVGVGSEAPLPVEAGAAERGDQHKGLSGDPERGADAEDEDLRRRDRRGVQRVGPGHDPEDEDCDDHDGVVEHRRPGARFVDVLDVQYCREHRTQAVEEDLRKQERGKRGGQVALRPAIDERRGDQRRREYCEQRHDRERGCGDGQQPLRVGDALVVVLCLSMDQQRNEHARQHAAEQELVHHVREIVAGVIGVADAADAERGGDEDRA
jgi:hypothetical protein